MTEVDKPEASLNVFRLASGLPSISALGAIFDTKNEQRFFFFHSEAKIQNMSIELREQADLKIEKKY